MSKTENKKINNIVMESLKDLKTIDIVSIDMKKKSSFTDILLIYIF